MSTLFPITPTLLFPRAENQHEHWLSLFCSLHFTVIYTVKKRALLLARKMHSVCGAATPAHQLSTIDGRWKLISRPSMPRSSSQRPTITRTATSSHGHRRVRERRDACEPAMAMSPVHVDLPNSALRRRCRRERDVPLCERHASGMR